MTRKTRFGSTNEEVYENVRKSIVSLINAIINNDYESIVKNELNPLFKNKITYLYNSENWLPTYSDNDLNIMLSVLEIPFDKEIDRVYKRKLLFDFYKSLNRPDITTLSFMDFIYSDLGYRPALRNYDAINLNDKKVKKYTLVKVNTIEEMVSQNKGKKHGLVIEKPETQVEKKMVGKKGEEIVKQYLNDHKKELYIIGDIDCACEYDDSLHYDFSYKNNLGQTIYIESKATKSNRNQNIVFEMSDGEYDFMKNNENNYYVFFINDIYNGTIIKEISASLIVGHPIKYRISITDISK